MPIQSTPLADSHQTSSPSHYYPTPRDLILLDLPTDIKVSPSGNQAVVSVRTTNWQANRYETVCYLHDVTGGTSYPLNRTGSVSQVEWLDAQAVALLKGGSGDDDKAQVFLYEGMVGEGWAVTEHECGVDWFMPFADGVLYLANRPDDDAAKMRSERFGTVTHFEQEPSKTALYYVGLAELRRYQEAYRKATPEEAKQLVRPVVELSCLFDDPISIRRVLPCPSGKAIYLNCWERDDLVYYRTVHSYCITLDPAAALQAHLRRSAETVLTDSQPETTDPTTDFPHLGSLNRLALPTGAYLSCISPDGATLLVAYQARDQRMFTRTDLWLLDTEIATTESDNRAMLAKMHNISAALDRDLFNMQWTNQGIYAGYVDGCSIRVVHFTVNGQVTPLDFGDIFSTGACHVSESGTIGLVGANGERTPEVYLAIPAEESAKYELTQLSRFGDRLTNWQFGKVETIRWQSKDGTEIEGVLRKPANFDPNKQYPLVFVVHGGPRGYSDVSLLTHPDRAYYPAIQFANADVLVLYPNYRGSTGRGQAFTELNVNNLGIGDLWDLESAIDHLAAQGWVDEAKIGCMGWSQGGYISAFAGLHSQRFCAVSVGAGISDWYTYHISNDIPHFTNDYLSGSPFQNREYYPPTAPMSNIANAKTPMLIQHGSDDRRVPLSNAMELYRGLQAMNVPVELFVYPGMGHPITKPRENHAVMTQNLTWFGHYLLGWELAL